MEALCAFAALREKKKLSFWLCEYLTTPQRWKSNTDLNCMRHLPLLLILLFSARSVAAQTYDVVVYSGVPCGVSAAIAAAREGSKTLLIEPTRHVGGLNTSGLNTAETEHMLKWTFGGIAQEFYLRMGQHYGKTGPAYYFESGVAERTFIAMLKEANVEVRYGLRVEKVEKDGATIRSLVLSDGSTVSAKVFVDAGYEGDVMARAGVGYTWGRESRAEYGEEAAGIRFEKKPQKAATVDEAGKLLPGMSGWARDFQEGAADKTVINYNWRLCFSRDPAWRAPLPEPRHYDRKRYRLLENWLHEQTAAGRTIKLTDIIDLYSLQIGRTKRRSIISRRRSFPSATLARSVITRMATMPLVNVSLRSTRITPWVYFTSWPAMRHAQLTCVKRRPSGACTKRNSLTMVIGPTNSMCVRHGA